MFGIIYIEQNKAILSVIFSGICFNGNLGIKKPVLGGKLSDFRGSAVSWIHISSTFIMNLHATEKVSATFGSVKGRLHCTIITTFQNSIQHILKNNVLNTKRNWPNAPPIRDELWHSLPEARLNLGEATNTTRGLMTVRMSVGLHFYL